MRKADAGSAHRHNRTICVPFSQEVYGAMHQNPESFRAYLNERIELFPELFPAGITRIPDERHILSQEALAPIRRIEVAGVAYTVRPSFLMPYITGVVEEIEKALFLRKFDVPFWALSYVFGKYPMYWYRLEQSVGRNSIVGTTVRDPGDIPQHLASDEKHTRILARRSTLPPRWATTVFSVHAVAKDPGEQSLQMPIKCLKMKLNA